MDRDMDRKAVNSLREELRRRLADAGVSCFEWDWFAHPLCFFGVGQAGDQIIFCARVTGIGWQEKKLSLTFSPVVFEITDPAGSGEIFDASPDYFICGSEKAGDVCDGDVLHTLGYCWEAIDGRRYSAEASGVLRLISPPARWLNGE